MRLILTGIAVAAGISAAMIVLTLRLDPDKYQFVASWLAGSIWGTNWKFVLALLPWVAVLLPFVFYKARVMNYVEPWRTDGYGTWRAGREGASHTASCGGRSRRIFRGGKRRHRFRWSDRSASGETARRSEASTAAAGIGSGWRTVDDLSRYDWPLDSSAFGNSDRHCGRRHRRAVFSVFVGQIEILTIKKGDQNDASGLSFFDAGCGDVLVFQEGFMWSISSTIKK